MWVPILTLILGFIALVWSADRFVSGAASTANNLGVSKMLIGLTVVSIGTSAPEILVALAASLDGTPMLAIGNSIGSNIANIGLVLGVTACLRELPFSASVRRIELPWLIGATLLALVCLVNLYLGTLDGLLFCIRQYESGACKNVGLKPGDLLVEYGDIEIISTPSAFESQLING